LAPRLIAVSFLPLSWRVHGASTTRKRLKRIVQARTSELTGLLTETLSVSGALLVKVFGREKAEVQRFSEKLQELKNLSLEQLVVGRWFQMVLGLFESIGPALAFAVSGTLVIRGHLALGTVVAFVTVSSDSMVLRVITAHASTSRRAMRISIASSL
jgi:ABC-type bacteriocin/lantibiotic exporter with double-glycine peptidase domain